MIDSSSLQDLLLRLDEIIEILNDYEDDCYVPLEVAHQLRDELCQIIPDDCDD